MVWKGLCEHPTVPVVVVKGSGGSADVLAEVLEKQSKLGGDRYCIVLAFLQYFKKNIVYRNTAILYNFSLHRALQKKLTRDLVYREHLKIRTALAFSQTINFFT